MQVVGLNPTPPLVVIQLGASAGTPSWWMSRVRAPVMASSSRAASVASSIAVESHRSGGRWSGGSGSRGPRLR